MNADIGDIATRCDDGFTKLEGCRNPNGLDGGIHTAIFGEGLHGGNSFGCNRNPAPDGRRIRVALRMNVRYLGAFNAHTSHQTLLIEDKGIGIIFQR